MLLLLRFLRHDYKLGKLHRIFSEKIQCLAERASEEHLDSFILRKELIYKYQNSIFLKINTK